MYQLSSKQLAVVLGTKQSDDVSATANAMEARVQRTLPIIAGLADAETDAERQAVFSRTIDDQRNAFIEAHGSPFGDEAIIEQRIKNIAPVMYVGAFVA